MRWRSCAKSLLDLHGMSNRSVLESLERELGRYATGCSAPDEAGKLLEAHIEALEGILHFMRYPVRPLRAGGVEVTTRRLTRKIFWLVLVPPSQTDLA